MAQPPGYTPVTDFSTDEALNVSGRSTVRTAQLDAEFSNLATTIAAVLLNIALNQRDDGEIRDKRVKIHTLADDVLALLASSGTVVRGIWTTATLYHANDIVQKSEGTYIAVVTHTSGVFDVDLANGKWIILTVSAASDITIVDAGNKYTATNVEGALAEVAVATGVDIVDVGNYYAGATVEDALQEIGVRPTLTRITSGAGTYTTPAGVSYLRYQIVGPGGGGASGGSSGWGNASTGTPTTFGPITANPGAHAISGPGFSFGVGGGGSIGGGAIGHVINGATGRIGQPVGSATVPPVSGDGGDAPFFGGGGAAGTSGFAAQPGNTNSGGGGGGGGSLAVAGGFGGPGGGAGGYVEGFIHNPAASYAYSVGTPGLGGAAGAQGAAGANGGSGYIVIWEYYS